MRISPSIPLACALTLAASAAVLPQPMAELTDRAATSYRNVAYFVNWVRLCLKFHKNIPVDI